MEARLPLPTNHSLREEQIECQSSSIGGTPVAAYVRVPFRGRVLQVGGVTGGVITTADSTVTTAINGTAITGGSFVITVSGAAAGQHFSAVPTGAFYVNENDVISFTPAGASGSNIPGSFYAIVQAG